MTGMKGLPLVAIASLLIVLAGCTTQSYYLEKKSEVTKIFEKAKNLYEQKHYNDAKEYFQQIVTSHSESPLAELAMYYLGGCYKEQGEYQKAISTYQELINKYHSGCWVDLAKRDIKKIKSTQ